MIRPAGFFHGQLTLLMTLVIAPAAGRSAEPGTPEPASLHEQVLGDALALIEKRREAFEAIKTPDDARRWQVERRKFFIEKIGGLPEPVLPKSRITGTIDAEDYRIEKVIFESRPNHHVTGLMYLPKRASAPFATMLICCGHSYDGKAFEQYQRVGILAARNGLAAFCFDPIGQGERYQTIRTPPLPRHVAGRKVRQELVAMQRLTPELPPHYDPVQEHTLMGIGPILLGFNVAHYRVWDAMRAVDYLLGRTDVDPRRIGVTGNSGGGTESAYLAALDDRIAAAAPGCFLTSYRSLLQNAGPQDAEQNIHGQLLACFDEADYVALAAPRPAQILAATRDATFDIAGTWELFRDAKRFYATVGHPERVDMVEVDEVHGFSVHLREAAVRWMRRWLLGIDDAIVESDVAIHRPEDLQCTPQGQVLLLEGERSVFDLTRDRMEELSRGRRDRAAGATPEDARRRVAALLGIDLDQPARATEVVSVESSARDRVGRVALATAGHARLAVSFVAPEKRTGELVIFVSPEGATASFDAEPMATWLRQGKVVAAVGLSGFGAEPTANLYWADHIFGPGIREFFVVYLAGRPLVGLRTEDLHAASAALSRHFTCDRVHVHAVGSAAIAALHAAALWPGMVSSTTLERSITSWEDVVTTPIPENQLANTVHGALAAYDLPDLVALAGGPDKLRIVAPVDARGMAR